MGRKKISITRIQDERNRQITFSKRKAGLLKKAYELSILCDVDIAMIMITSNRKLYQYASSNMNSILIRYTEFKDPDENKTNADILDDITKKERGADNDSGEEDGTSFLLTPRTQENYRKIDEEFDHIMQHNQVPPAARVVAPAPPLGSAPPQVMPVTVPVTKSVHQTIHQHLVSKEQRSSGGSSGQSSAPLSSAFMSPQSSDLSSASPLGMKDRPPGSMPPPLVTPTRLQTIRNQTLKLHLPGSGRSYIPLQSAGLSAGSHGDSESKKSAGSEEVDLVTKPGAKPPLRVYIPGQKEFVPRTQATSPLPQVSLPVPPTTSVQPVTTTTTVVDSLTTPVLNLQTPSIYSNLPPMFSSLMGDFPFNQPPAAATSNTTSTGGDSSSAALVAFPVSIQPSGGAGPGNLILHAQNMGQPFLLTPSVDGRQGTAQNFTPPAPVPPGLSATVSPNIKDFEQLKAQYERTQQMIHQQLLFSQMQSMLQQSTRATPTSGTQATPTNVQAAGPSGDMDSGLGGQESEADKYINGADVMMGGRSGRGGAPDEPLAKRSRLSNSPSSIHA